MRASMMPRQAGYHAGHRGVQGRQVSEPGMRMGQLVLDVAPLRESRDFRWLFSGRLVASAGDVVATTAASWQVYSLTRSPLAAGLLTLTEGVDLRVSRVGGGVLPAAT